MKNNKYKILVLSDMKDTATNTLKSGVSLAKMIDGELHFFHVKKPTDVVEKESQLSAIRTINRSYLATKNDIENVVEPISKDFDIPISHSHAFGNIKSEITDYIKTNTPDVIILGKRKSKTLSFIGDNITDFVIKNYNGVVMIASEENTLEPNKELSLGVLNSSSKSFNSDLFNSVLNHTQKPLKSFKTSKEVEVSFVGDLKDNQTVELVFDNGENSVKSVSNYLTKSNVNLLCLDRNNENKANVKNAINNVNISLLISNDKYNQS